MVGLGSEASHAVLVGSLGLSAFPSVSYTCLSLQFSFSVPILSS